MIPVVGLIIAQIVVARGHFTSDAIAAPSAIMMAGARALLDGSILVLTGQTLAAVIVGLGIGCGLGVSIGSVLGTFPTINRSMEFTVEALRPIPSVALLPLAMLIFGFGYRMEFSLIAFSAMWPMLILTRQAVAHIEPCLIEVSRMVGFGFLNHVVKIILPATLPRLFVAFRLAAGFALTVAITVEIAANPLGLGYAMITAQLSLHPALMLALLIWVGIIGWLFNGGLLWAQRRLFGPSATAGLEQ